MDITLKNFQCHERISVHIDKVTFILGPTNVGKSAIVRSVAWLSNDLNVGAQKLLRRGAKKEMEVSITTDTTSITKRFDSKGIHVKIDDTQYPNVGSNPPQLPLTIQIQHQFDPFFLVTDPPTEVLRKIESVTKVVTQLSKLKELVAADLNSLKAALSYNELQLKHVEGMLLKTEGLNVTYEKVLSLDAIINTKALMERRKRQVLLQLCIIRYMILKAKLLKLLRTIMIFTTISKYKKYKLLQQSILQTALLQQKRAQRIIIVLRYWKEIQERRIILILLTVRRLLLLKACNLTKEATILALERYNTVVKEKKCPLCGQPLPI
ncbi:MAG: AAA family ATPase [Candidatus Methanomethylicaceae archaeon]